MQADWHIQAVPSQIFYDIVGAHLWPCSVGSRPF